MRFTVFFLSVFFAFVIADVVSGDEVELVKVLMRFDRAMKANDWEVAADAALLAWEKHRDAKPELLEILRGNTYSSVGAGILDQFNPDRGIGKEWADRAARLPVPSVQMEEEGYIVFAACRLRCSTYYAKSEKPQLGEAHYHFAVANGILEKFADNKMLQSDFGRSVRDETEKMSLTIQGNGIRRGSYVTNANGAQEWIGVVDGIDGKALSVRMTWVGKKSGFVKGKAYPLMVDQDVKILDRVAPVPMAEGYKSN